MKIKIGDYEAVALAIENLPWGNGEAHDEAAYALLNECDRWRAGKGSKVTTAERLMKFAPNSVTGWSRNSILTWLYLRKFSPRNC